MTRTRRCSGLSVIARSSFCSLPTVSRAPSKIARRARRWLPLYLAILCSRPPRESLMTPRQWTGFGPSSRTATGASIRWSQVSCTRSASAGNPTGRRRDSREPTWTEASWPDIDLAGADMRDADLGGANLRGSRLDPANLEGANLVGANLRGSSMERVETRQGRLESSLPRAGPCRAIPLSISPAGGRQPGRGRTSIEQIFADADLTHAQLADASLVGADLRSAKLEEADFSRADLSGATCRG